MSNPSEVPLLKAIVTSLGGVPVGQTEVPLLKQILELLDNGVISGDSLPSQTGHAGEYLTTDGTTASWGALAGGGDVVASGVLALNAIALGGGGTTVKTTTTGTGVVTALGVNTGSAGAIVLFNGAGGTPSSLNLTNASALPLTTGVTGVLGESNGGTGQSQLIDLDAANLGSGGALNQFVLAADGAGGCGWLEVALAGAVTASKITMTSARLLGRTTAATGSIEEITVGSGLTLSAGTLTTAASVGDMLKSVYDPRNLSLITGLPGTDSGANTGGVGGQIDMHGGNAAAGGNGGTSGEIHTHGGNANGASAGGSGGNINTESDGVFNGGHIDTRGSTADGGSIFTANGGGTINTQGVGLVEFGVAGTRTSLVGQAASDITVTLPAAATTLVGRDTTDTLTNKGINGSNNTITNVSLTTGVTGTLPLGNGGTGQTTAQTAIDALMAASGALAQGDVFYYNGTNVVRLAAGTADHFLQTKGAGQNPVWAAGGGGSGGATNVYVPASAMIPRVTNGAGVNSSETATNDVNYDTLDFDATTSEGAQFWVTMPNNWDAGTVTFKPHWTADSGTGDATFTLAGRSLANDDAIDTAFGTAQSSTDTLIATGDMHIGPASAAITIGGTPANGVPVVFQVTRDIADTLNADARLIGIEITFT